MKAILVIDLPDKYRIEDILADYCLHTKGEYKVIRKGGNHPLKPLPEEKDVGYPINDYAVGFSDGWDVCIKEIGE